MRSLLVVFVFLVVSACALSVQSRVTVFHNFPATGNDGTIGIINVKDAEANTLEAQDYSHTLAVHLEAAGYRVVSSEDLPEYFAFWEYGIDDGTLESRAVGTPIFGVTGFRGLTTNESLDPGSLVTPTGTPTYPTTVYQTGFIPRVVYRHFITLNIFDSAKIIPDEPESIAAARLYEARLTSAGSCGSIAGVIDELLGALFEEFPGESGSARTVSVPYDGRC